MDQIKQARALLLKLAEGLSEEEIAQADAEVALASLRGQSLPFRHYTPTSEAAARIAEEIEGILASAPQSKKTDLTSAVNLARILASREDRPAHAQAIMDGLKRRVRLKWIHDGLRNPPIPYTVYAIGGTFCLVQMLS